MSIGREMCVDREKHFTLNTYTGSTIPRVHWIGNHKLKCMLVSQISCLFFILPYTYHEIVLNFSFHMCE